MKRLIWKLKARYLFYISYKPNIFHLSGKTTVIIIIIIIKLLLHSLKVKSLWKSKIICYYSNTKRIIDLLLITIIIKIENSPRSEFYPIEYSDYLNRTEISDLIRQKMESPSIEARWFKCLETLDLEQIDEFKMKFKNTSNPREMVRNVKKI